MLDEKIVTLIELVLGCDYKHIKEKVWISPRVQFRDKCWSQIQSWAEIMIFHCYTFLAFHQFFRQFLWQHSRSAKCFFGNQIPIFCLGTFREFVARFTGQFPSSCQWFPRMDSPEVEQNVSWTEKKRVTVKKPFRSSWWGKKHTNSCENMSRKSIKDWIQELFYALYMECM